MQSDGAIVRAQNLSRVFKGKKASATALEGLDLSIPAGQMTAFVGPDGAGKTTFLRLACGLLAPTSGSLTVLGLDSVRHAQDIQDRISYMPQRFGLYEDLSVQENLDLYADLHGIPGAVRRERFDRLLDMTDLGRFTARPAGKLSGGMKQKLALACTLVRSPELLLLDEPSVGVDPLSRRELWDIIELMVKEERLSVILSTAYMDEAERCAQVFILHEGHILAQDSPEGLRALTAGLCYEADMPPGVSARRFQSWLLDQSGAIMDAVPSGNGVRFVLGDSFRGKPLPALPPAPEGFLLTQERCRSVPPRLEDSFMFLLKKQAAAPSSPQDSDAEAPRPEGKPPVPSPSAHPPAPALPYAPASPAGNPYASRTASPGASDETVIEVCGLVRKFGDFTAVDSTTFSVQRGEVFGLLGPNGAGKTTTFRMLCGLLPATSGRLSVAGEDLRTAAAQARAKVGYVSQRFSLYGNLSVMDNLRFFGGVYGLRRQALRQRIRDVLEQFGLAGREDELSGSLPGGFKQRLAMAVGLLHSPEILFLDEPTSGIDPLARRAFWARITELAEQGVTIVITTHFMEEAEYCDRLLIQDAGRVLALGSPAEIRALGGHAPAMEEAFIRIVEKARAAEAAKPKGGQP